MSGFEVRFSEQNGEPELIRNYSLDLPSSLTNPQKMKLVRNHLNDVKSTTLPDSIFEELKQTRQNFRETVGLDVTDTANLLLVKEREALNGLTGNVAPEFIDKVKMLLDDDLITTGTDLIYEALKNTYDAVIIRNYLASMPLQALKAKEPLVYAAMQKNYITEISPAHTTIEFRALCTLTPEGSKMFITDNGPGKDIVDAFKLQHSSDSRARMNQLDLDANLNLDSIYNKGTGRFDELGLRTGGVGKGRKAEERILKSIGATSEFSPSLSGIALNFYRNSKSPSIEPTTLDFEEEMPSPFNLDDYSDDTQSLIQTTPVEDSDEEELDNEQEAESSIKTLSLDESESEEESELSIPTTPVYDTDSEEEFESFIEPSSIKVQDEEENEEEFVKSILSTQPVDKSLNPYTTPPSSPRNFSDSRQDLLSKQVNESIPPIKPIISSRTLSKPSLQKHKWRPSALTIDKENSQPPTDAVDLQNQSPRPKHK